jgi:hypothetical protein
MASLSYSKFSKAQCWSLQIPPPHPMPFNIIGRTTGIQYCHCFLESNNNSAGIVGCSSSVLGFTHLEMGLSVHPDAVTALDPFLAGEANSTTREPSSSPAISSRSRLLGPLHYTVESKLTPPI